MLPQFPPDVWYRIAHFSSPETLSALSQVSTTLNKLAILESHFTRFIPVTHLSPIQAYRREAALLQPSTTVSSTPSDVRRIIRANDMALLYNCESKSFTAFPTGHLFPIHNAHVQISVYMHFPMMDEIIGFLSENRRRFFMFDLRTGHISSVPLLKYPEFLRTGYRIVLAGNHGESLLQRTKDTFFLCDRRTGETTSTYPVPDNFILVIGELSNSHDGTCVGYATTTVKEDVRTVYVHGFDGVKTTFQVPEEHTVECVLRSADTLTHVLVTHRNYVVPKYFIATRGSTVWQGFLREMIRPRLAENGTVIMSSREGTQQRRKRFTAFMTILIVLNDPARETVHRTYMISARVYTHLVWARRIRGYVLTLLRGRLDNDKLELINVSYNLGCRNEQLLKEWVIPDLCDAQVVADHYILARSRLGGFHLIHFDSFCNGAGGVYACPLVGSSTHCYFPDQFRGGDDALHERKRSRIGAGSQAFVEWV